MNNLKSISFLFFSITLFCYVNGIGVIRNKKKTINDLLAKTDFNFYLDSLEKLVDFYTNHKFYVDLSAAFGLFMVDVNLSGHLQQQQYDIPVKIRSRLEKLLLKIDELSEYFHAKVQEIKPTNAEENKRDLKLSELFNNKTTWTRAPDKFSKRLVKHWEVYGKVELKERYGEWETYKDEVNNSTTLDDCLSMLVRNLPSESPKQCDLPRHCKKRVGGGTDVGFTVSQWVFVMIMARFSRQCFVFSENEDKNELDEYCLKYFHEVQYIACNDFKLPIVASHHCALCGMLGHAQFLRRFWHKKLIQFQTAEGCFSDKIQVEKFEDSQTREDILRAEKDDTQARDERDNKWNIVSRSTFKDEKCDAHFTSVSLLTVSNALRYIIETHYIRVTVAFNAF